MDGLIYKLNQKLRSFTINIGVEPENQPSKVFVVSPVLPFFLRMSQDFFA
jgi:hypothetical protein